MFNQQKQMSEIEEIFEKKGQELIDNLDSSDNNISINIKPSSGISVELSKNDIEPPNDDNV